MNPTAKPTPHSFTALAKRTMAAAGIEVVKVHTDRQMACTLVTLADAADQPAADAAMAAAGFGMGTRSPDALPHLVAGTCPK